MIACLVILATAGSLFYPRWQKSQGEAQLSWDAGGYYWYLPSVFIYKDLKHQSFKDSVLRKYQMTPPEDFQYGYLHEASGNYVLRYTFGMALMEAPFFFIAHTIAAPLGYPADGFSRPYQFMIYLGGVLIAFLGLFYLRKLLLYYFSDRTVAITLLLLVFGTNYLNYAGIDVGMTHSWLFTLYVFLLLNTHHFYTNPQKKYILRIGVLIGILTLIRPPEIISVLIPLLWGINNFSKASIIARIQLWRSFYPTILLGGLFLGIFLSLPFLYWKWATGEWFVYTYRDQGFDWLHPLLYHYPMNYQTGWLMHTPVMFLTIIGIIPFLLRGKNRLALISFALLNFYIVCAWKAWDYGGRAMIQSYPVLLFFLATFIEWILAKKWRWLLATPILLLFTYYNLWWTYQAHAGQGLSFGAPSNKTYYFNTALRYNVPTEYMKMRDNLDFYKNEISESQITQRLSAAALGVHELKVQNEQQQLIKFDIRNKGEEWFRAQADFYTEQIHGDLWNGPIFGIKLWKGDQTLKYNMIRAIRFIQNGKKITLSLDLEIPNTEFDAIELEFRNENSGRTAFTVSNIQLIGFKE